ncbi:MAG: gliding motility protein GldN [Bacteroidota bacterium]|nr:gliding motility protein GldN [Bacteroidota bacterium]
MFLRKSSLVTLIFGLFSFYAIAQVEEDEGLTESSNPEDTSGYLDDIVDRYLIREQRVLNYDLLREADVVWQKRIWRVIDVREKMNIEFLYPDRPFFKILVDAAKDGDIGIFRNEDFSRKLTAEDLDKELNRVDTTVVWDPDTYEEKVTVVKSEIDFNKIKKFRIKEIWYFDKEASRVFVRILGIAPINEKVDESTGEVTYEAPLFWIYYPEARHILSKELAFNEKNDVSPISWADLFDGRFFSSYIFKQSNVQGNRLQDIYAPKEGEDALQAGINLLLESEKIKNELLNFEHDLWVY